MTPGVRGSLQDPRSRRKTGGVSVTSSFHAILEVCRCARACDSGVHGLGSSSVSRFRVTFGGISLCCGFQPWGREQGV